MRAKKELKECIWYANDPLHEKGTLDPAVMKQKLLAWRRKYKKKGQTARTPSTSYHIKC